MTASPSLLPQLNPALRILSLMVRLAPTGLKFFHRSILLRRRYRIVGEVVAPEGFQSAWAGPREIEYLDRHPEATSRSAYARRADRGDVCLCLKQGEEVIGYRWATRRSACVFCGFGPGYELLFFPLQAHQVFVYDSYVYRAHRGRGFSKLIRELFQQAVYREGVRESYSLVTPENSRSLKLALLGGSEPLCMAYGFRIRSWSKMVLGPNPDPQLQQWLSEFKVREGII